MFTSLFNNFLKSFGIAYRMLKAFFLRQIVGFGMRLKRVTSVTRYVSRLFPRALASIALIGKKPTKREDFVETRRLYIAKSLLVVLILGAIAISAIVYTFVWPWFLSSFLTARFYMDDPRVKTYNGKVELFYDEKKTEPEFTGRLKDGVAQGPGISYGKTGATVYDGGYSDGVYSGQGALYDNTAVLYRGGFAAGLYDGSGELYDDNAPIYSGGFKAGEYNGQGTLYKGGAVLYQGSFAAGLYDGSGELYADGAPVYSGGFKAGEYDGQGTLYKGKAVYYKGEFSAGLMQGNGVEYTDTGDTLYSGGFSNSLYEGKGSLYDNGSLIYSGNFAAGLMDGDGTEYYPGGAVKYKGAFKSGLYDSQGVLYAENGSITYTGGFLDGMYQGAGELYTTGGLLMDAAFDKGAVKGDASVYHDGALVYAGAVKNGRPEGFGTLYDSKSGNAIYKGSMANGDVDAASLLGISADDARKAFADAKTAEMQSGDAEFCIVNTALGVTVFFPLKTGSQPVNSIGVYRYTGQADTLNSLDMKSQSDAAANDQRSEGSQTVDFAGSAPFPAGRYYRVTLPQADYVFSIWSRDKGGDPFMLEWDTPGGAPAAPAGAPADMESADQDRVGALLAALSLLPDTTASGQAQSPAGETPGASGSGGNPFYGGGDLSQLLDSLPPAQIQQTLTALTDYLENAEKSAAYGQQLTIVQNELTNGAGSSSPSGSPSPSSQLNDDAASIQSQINICAIGMEKAVTQASLPDGENLSDYDVSQVLFAQDPAGFDTAALQEAAQSAGNVGSQDFKLEMLDLGTLYQEVLLAQTTYQSKSASYNDTLAQYRMSKASEQDKDNAALDQLNAQIALYTNLCAYSSEIIVFNGMTGGALARAYHWFPDLFPDNKAQDTAGGIAQSAGATSGSALQIEGETQNVTEGAPNG